MDLDQHQENSLFSLDGLGTEDILVHSEDENESSAGYPSSSFKNASDDKNEDNYDFSPKYYPSCNEEKEVAPNLQRVSSSTKTDCETDTNYSSSNSERPKAPPKNRCYKKSSFNGKANQAVSDKAAIEDFIHQSNSSMLGEGKGVVPSLLSEVKAQPNIVTNSEVLNPVNRAPSDPVVHNIVSTSDLRCKLDLKMIAMNARNTEYNPKRFDAAIMKIRNPKTTALIFSSGKIVCSGARSEEDSKRASKKFAKTLKNLGFNVKFTNFKIVNMVAAADIGFDISLSALSVNHAEYCDFEPEIFAGLIYRVYKPKVTLMIFSTGKMNVVGAQRREDIHEAYKLILPILRNYKKAVRECDYSP